MKVNFITPTKISLIDITSMGDSSKRGDENTIGQFDSGLKYAIALLLRNNVGVSIRVAGEPIIHENYEEAVTINYTFSSYIDKCDNTGKEKELIQVECETIPHGGDCMSQYDMREPSSGDSWIVKTGFAKALGHNWLLYMALRELWSNMLDEGGEISTGIGIDDNEVEGTVITLDFDEENAFYDIWQNRHLYINEEEPLFILDDSTQVLENEEGYLRIYKQNILVHEDRNKPSRFAWNIKNADIDERRLIRDVSQIEQNITQSICYTNNEDFLREIITADFEVKEGEFLEKSYSYSNASDLMHNIATEISEKHGDVKSYDWIISKIRSRRDCKISGKTIKTISDSLWGYSKDVVIESKPQVLKDDIEIIEDEVMDAKSPLQKEIDKHYNFILDVEVRTAKLKGSKVVKDGYENCIIISEDFNVETDFSEFLVEYIDLTRKGNIVKNLAEFILEMIKK